MPDRIGTAKTRDQHHSWFEWAHLLIALCVPIAIIIYTMIQYQNDLKIANDRRRQDLAIAEENRQQDRLLANQSRMNDLIVAEKNILNERLIADNHQKDTILNDYLHALGQLIERHGTSLNNTNDIEASPAIASFRTLAVVTQLDPIRKVHVLRALYEANLIRTRPWQQTAVVSLQKADFRDIDLSVPSDRRYLSRYLLNIHLQQAVLINASFRALCIGGSNFYNTRLDDTDFSETTTGHLSPCANEEDGSVTVFTWASLVNARFTRATYENVSFSRAIMDNVQFDQVVCMDCEFWSTSVVGANFSYSFLFGYRQSANFSGPRTYNVLSYKTSFYNYNLDYTSLMGWNGLQSIFSRCRFTLSQVIQAAFDQSEISNSSFDGTMMTGSILNGAKIRYCRFNKAKLVNMDFRNAQFYSCFFNDSDFTGSDFSNVTFIETNFAFSNVTAEQLRQARSLINVLLPNDTFVNLSETTQ